ncbi:hypothetical protein ACJRO7_033993 [Eucalyptus globulus]|uniref:Uncharacterized protein n=1 Tax=Eucalyptus globulus TaxID=34317 RepID=A0ABD3J5Z2_EUCGL
MQVLPRGLHCARQPGLSAHFRSVSSHLLTLGSLESLSLTSANIGGALAFPSGSKCSAVLSSLDLSGNALSGPISGIASLVPCQNLRVLNFSGNNLDNSGQESARRHSRPQGAREFAGS